MSDHMMSVEEARAVLDLDSAPLVMRQASRTIVALYEQIARLQAALREADEERHDMAHHSHPLNRNVEYVEDWEALYDLLPGDMDEGDTDE